MGGNRTQWEAMGPNGRQWDPMGGNGTQREATGADGRQRDPTPRHTKSASKLNSYTTNIARTPTEQALFGEILISIEHSTFSLARFMN